jgi:6-phosphofructokinase 2
VEVQSRVGAGDSMVGGMALALARGASMREAARFGIAAGAAAVMTPGTGLCRRADAERLFQQMSG